MRIEILEGYQNGYSIENNSVTLRINTDLLLNQHLNRAVKEADDIHKIMSDFTKKYISFFTIHFGWYMITNSILDL